jgi:hypothetical protein
MAGSDSKEIDRVTVAFENIEGDLADFLGVNIN